jgi:hypothetical protein
MDAGWDDWDRLIIIEILSPLPSAGEDKGEGDNNFSNT